MPMHDLLVIGGGINGTAIARDAAGRGLRVLLIERDDLAQHTSSASSKLIHGGLRYLEMGDIRLVREALAERETLLRTAPHLVHPLRFLLARGPGSRSWPVLRAGLLLYDLLAIGGSLPRSRALAFPDAGLKPAHARGFAYWDAWVDDARLVILNARDAADRGADVRTRTTLVSARRDGDCWIATLDGSAGRTEVAARAIVNAAGPWVAEVLGGRLGDAAPPVRLIRGSHLVVPRLPSGNDAALLQQPDGRVVFLLPHEEDFTLVGTTDAATNDPAAAHMSAEERAYLLAAANRYLAVPISAADIVAEYSGIRSLHDDGKAEARAVSRDYTLVMDAAGPPRLSVYGGKITTARALAEETMARLGRGGLGAGPAWTARSPLPGGDLGTDFDSFSADFAARHPLLDTATARRVARAYGIRSDAIFAHGTGRLLMPGLWEAELDHLRRNEWARAASDVLWRRTKLGLRALPGMAVALAAHMEIM